MSRASWGSVPGDLSGLFASLIDQFQNRAEAATQRQMARSAEAQAAEDADTYDKWNQGLISDGQWLAYIRTRIEETKGDPKEHEQWKEAFRQHSQAIEDGQAEAAYQAGRITLNQLIAHYADRLKGIEKNSPEYRTQQSHYYDLIDQRDSNLIDDKSAAILAQIRRGNAGYGELLKFYENMLSKVRTSSPLYRQIKQNIQSIRDVVDGVTGGSGGGGGGGGSSGGGSGSSYQQASDAVLKLWTSGNVFVPGGNDVVRSVLDVYNTNLQDDSAVWNALGEDSVVIENLMDYAQKNPDAPYLETPWGDKIPNTLENRQLLMNQGLRGYDYRLALGNATGRSVIGVLDARDAFVNSTFGAENSAKAEDYWRQVRQNVWEQFTLASQQPNPEDALKMYAAAGKTLEAAASNILGKPVNVVNVPGQVPLEAGQERTSVSYDKTALFPEEQVDDKMKAELDYAIELAGFAKNSANMTPEEANQAASILFDKRPEGFWLTDSDLQNVLGSDVATATDTGLTTEFTVGTGIIGKEVAKRGLDADAAVKAGGFVPDGTEPYQYVGVPGQTAPLAVPVNSINKVLGVDDYKDARSAIGGWEKAGGTTVWVIRPLQDVKTPQWYVNDAGKWMTKEQVASFNGDLAAIQKAGYSLQNVPGLTGWKSVIAGDGQTWYVDPLDGHLYPGAPPFKPGITGPVFDYADFVDSGGNLDLEKNRFPGSTGLGYVAFWTKDVTTREVQQRTDDILNNPYDDRIDLRYFHERDDKNNVSFDPLPAADVAGMFWSASDSALRGPSFKINLGRTKDEQLRQDALDRAELRRQAQVTDWINTKLAADPRNAQYLRLEAADQGLNVRGFAQEQIDAAATAAGITLGRERGIQKAEQADNFVAPPPTPLPPANTPPVQILKPPVPTITRQVAPEINKVTTPPPPVAIPIPKPPSVPLTAVRQSYIDKMSKVAP